MIYEPTSHELALADAIWYNQHDETGYVTGLCELPQDMPTDEE